MTRARRLWLWFWLALLGAFMALIATAPEPAHDEYGPATLYQGEP